MKSPHRPAHLSSAALILTCIALGACSTPPEANPLDRLPYDTGTVVQTEGDTITVAIDRQLVKIRLEGFAGEGAHVAAAVRRSPAHGHFRGESAVAAR